MSKNQRVLGDGAVGDIEQPDAKHATQQPGLIDSPERPGKTAEEQAAAELKAQQKEDKQHA